MFSKKKNKEERILPKHIAIIMDGNGRWAKKRSLPRTAGHAAGAKTFKEIARYANKIGIKYLTVYVFSTENWKRPKEEVDNIMNILRDYLKDTKNFKNENISLQFIGNISVLPDDIKQLIAEAEAKAAKLIETARAEADKLVEKASNPIAKVAAKAAANKLIEEAERQAAKLIEEAKQ